MIPTITTMATTTTTGTPVPLDDVEKSEYDISYSESISYQ